MRKEVTRLQAELTVAVRHAEKVFSIFCLVWSTLQPHMMAFLAKTLSQMLFSRQILLILQHGKMGVRGFPGSIRKTAVKMAVPLPFT